MVVESEFVDLDGCKWKNPEAFIRWLFNSRCIICKELATEINEIIPRARSKDSIKNWRNRVTLCQKHHKEYHHNGLTDDKIMYMQLVRQQFLLSIGRGKYV